MSYVTDEPYLTFIQSTTAPVQAYSTEETISTD